MVRRIHDLLFTFWFKVQDEASSVVVKSAVFVLNALSSTGRGYPSLFKFLYYVWRILKKTPPSYE